MVPMAANGRQWGKLTVGGDPPIAANAANAANGRYWLPMYFLTMAIHIRIHHRSNASMFLCAL